MVADMFRVLIGCNSPAPDLKRMAPILARSDFFLEYCHQAAKIQAKAAHFDLLLVYGQVQDFPMKFLLKDAPPTRGRNGVYLFNQDLPANASRGWLLIHHLDLKRRLARYLSESLGVGKRIGPRYKVHIHVQGSVSLGPAESLPPAQSLGWAVSMNANGFLLQTGQSFPVSTRLAVLLNGVGSLGPMHLDAVVVRKAVPVEGDQSNFYAVAFKSMSEENKENLSQALTQIVTDPSI